MPRFRIDRALALGPMAVSARSRRGLQIPILMYHGIRNQLGRRHPFFETNTAKVVFECHLQYLLREGYVGIDLAQTVDALRTGKCPPKCVAITVDDGYRDFYTQALPLLKEYGFTATLFIASGLVGRQHTRLGPEPLMTWQEIRDAQRQGIRIGSHTVAHLDLYRGNAKVLQDEVYFSKTMIEDNLGEGVSSFAYPYAFPEQDRTFTDRLERSLEGAGYTEGVCTVIGTAGPRDRQYFLPRLPMNSYDDDVLLAAKLEGRYDWVHGPQYVAKWIKGRLGALQGRRQSEFVE